VNNKGSQNKINKMDRSHDSNDVYRLACDITDSIENICAESEEWWVDVLEFLLKELEGRDLTFEQILDYMLHRNYMQVGVQADISTSKAFINLTSPKGQESADKDFDEFSLSVPYCIKVVESLYPDATNVTNTLFGTANTADVTNDDFRKVADIMKTTFPLAFQVFSACSQQGGRMEICKLVLYALSALVFCSQAKVAEEQLPSKELKKRKEKIRKKKPVEPLVNAPRPQASMSNVIYHVTIDSHKTATVVASGRVLVGDQVALKWEYTIVFNPDGSMNNAVYNTLEVMFLHHLTEDMERVLNRLFRPATIKMPQTRGLEGFCDMHPTVTVSFNSTDYKIRFDQSDSGAALATTLETVFGVSNSYLTDAAGTVVPYALVASGERLVLHTVSPTQGEGVSCGVDSPQQTSLLRSSLSNVSEIAAVISEWEKIISGSKISKCIQIAEKLKQQNIRKMTDLEALTSAQWDQLDIPTGLKVYLRGQC